MIDDIGGTGYESSSSSSSDDNFVPAVDDFVPAVDDNVIVIATFTIGRGGNGEQNEGDVHDDDIDEEETDEDEDDEEEADEDEDDEEEAGEDEFMFQEEDDKDEEDNAVHVPWETDIGSLWSRATVTLSNDDGMFFKRMQELLAGYTEADIDAMRGDNEMLRALLSARHPTFDNLLDHLGDPLDVIHLVAVSPPRVAINLSNTIECRRLSLHWQAYIACTHKLRKVFMHRDAMFFQAKVNGHDITWSIQRLVPQKLPDDVYRKVWFGFIRFFTYIMKVVNIKLYRGVSLDCCRLPKGDFHPLLEHVLGELAEQGNNDEDEETKVCKSLFQDKKFFLGREVSREPLLFVITSFGGVVSYEGEAVPFGEEDDGITYQVVCSPLVGQQYPGRAYIQPQWILDCINQKKILPTEDYLMDRVCPPHLSPFV